jgi:hypothetical protein
MVVTQEGFASMSDARCTVMGRFSPVEGAVETAAAREAYLARHPEAFWVDFGDFSYLRMNDVVAANLIAGFGRATKVGTICLESLGTGMRVLRSYS